MIRSSLGRPDSAATDLPRPPVIRLATVLIGIDAALSSRPLGVSPMPQAAAQTADKVKIACEWCGGRIRVPKAVLGKRGKCPKCGETTRLGDRPPRREPPPPADDWLDGLDDLSAGPPPAVATPARKAAAKSPAKSYGWQIAVGVSAAVFAVAAVLPERDLLPLAVIELIAGGVLVGLLFLPRKHLLGSAPKVDMTAFAGKGIAGAVGLAAVIGLRAYGRIRRKQASGQIDLGGMEGGDVLGILVAIAAIVGAVLFGFWLWRRIGIVRTLAAGYLVQIAGLIVMAVVAAFGPELPEERNARTRMEVGTPTPPAGMQRWTSEPPPRVTNEPRLPPPRDSQPLNSRPTTPQRPAAGRASRDWTPASESGDSFFGE